MAFAFDNRQAVKMGAHAAHQQMIAVVHQMLRGYRGGDVVARLAHQFRRFGGSDVFKHDFELRHLRHDGLHHALDKGGFAVKDVNAGVGYFAVRQQQDVLRRHFVQHGQQLE